MPSKVSTPLCTCTGTDMEPLPYLLKFLPLPRLHAYVAQLQAQLTEPDMRPDMRHHTNQVIRQLEDYIQSRA